MHPREVDFLRRLIADLPLRRAAGVYALQLSETEGIGKVRGASVEYTAADHAKARNLLTSRGYDLVIPQGPFTRSEAPAGGSEKSKALRVSADMVAVSTVNIDGFKSPRGGFLAMPIHEAVRIPFSVLLVVENMEPLVQLDSYTWLDRFIRARPTLALFRGAPGFFRTDVAATFIAQDSNPLLAFFDFDPKGLAMAASLPRREAMCLPDTESLTLATVKYRRVHLFSNSLHACRTQLDAIVDGEISEAWRLMKSLSLGLDQEHFPR